MAIKNMFPLIALHKSDGSDGKKQGYLFMWPNLCVDKTKYLFSLNIKQQSIATNAEPKYTFDTLREIMFAGTKVLETKFVGQFAESNFRD